MRSAWVEVNLKAIEENTRIIKELVGEQVNVLSVVKADAYGHGLVNSALAAIRGGADLLGVAIVEEAQNLRSSGITKPILILGCAFKDQAADILEVDASAVVSYEDCVCALSKVALEQGKVARVHVKVNTGMGRVGVRYDEAADFIERVSKVPGIELEGIMTHYATADYDDHTSLNTQYERFVAVLDEVKRRGITVKYIHSANSAAIMFHPKTYFNTVRPGIMTYGQLPVPIASDVPPQHIAEDRAPLSSGKGKDKRLDLAKLRFISPEDLVDNKLFTVKLQPALSLRAKVVQVMKLNSGDAVGYGLTYRATRDSIFALLPIGYADGVSRSLSNSGFVLINGQRAPIAGRVSMDQTIVDITDIPQVKVGDVATLIGTYNDESITAWEVALTMRTIVHEVLCTLGARLPRMYKF